MSPVAPSRLLITGFVPFPGRDGVLGHDNPSESLARALAPLADTVTILPVTWAHTSEALAAALVGHTHWLGFGLSSGTTALKLETIALNIAYSTVPDNDGHPMPRASLSDSGPLAEEVGFDPAAAVAAAAEGQLELQISHHAGTYLCNRALHLALRARAEGRLTQGAFVHVPPSEVMDPVRTAQRLTPFVEWFRSLS